MYNKKEEKAAGQGQDRRAKDKVPCGTPQLMDDITEL